jgi:hypothetical protein
MPEETTTPAARLTGQELIAKVDSIKPLPLEDLAAACNYTTKAGKPDTKAFGKALSVAMGLTAPSTRGSSTGRTGKPPSWKATIGTKGAVVVGAAYIGELGLEPGATVQLLRVNNCLVIHEENVVPLLATGPVPELSLPAVATYDSESVAA